MAIKSISEIKQKFAPLARPTAGDFGDLIDTFEGRYQSLEGGFKGITPTDVLPKPTGNLIYIAMLAGTYNNLKLSDGSAAPGVTVSAEEVNPSGIYDRVELRFNGTWAKVAVQKREIGPVTPEKTTFANKVIGKNKINPALITTGYYVNWTGSGIGLNPAYDASADFEIKANTNYTFTNVIHYQIKTSTGVFLKGGSAPGVVNSGVDAAIMRVDFYTGQVATVQVEEGSVKTPVEPYKENTEIANLLPPADNSIGWEKTSFVNKAIGKNKINPASITTGYYVSWEGSGLGANPSYDASADFEIKANTDYALTNIVHYQIKTSAGVFLKGGRDGAVIINSGPLAARMRVSFYTGQAATVQVEEGSAQTPIEPFREGLTIPGFIIEDSPNFELVMPPEIFLTTGATEEIYNEQIAIVGNVNNYHYQWQSSYGKPLKRKFSIASAPIGNHNVVLNVFDNKFKLIASGSSVIRSNNPFTGSLKVLSLGDSISNNKPWMQYIRDQNSNIQFVGTRGVGMLMHEGRSGWAASHYLAATAYSYEGEGVHPFWNGTRFSWNYYKANTGVNPDAIVINLGTNQISNAIQAAADLKQIVDFIRQDDAIIHIYIVLVHHWADQNGLGGQTGVDGFQTLPGAFDYDIRRKVLLMAKQYISVFGAYSNLHFVPFYATMDRRYNYGLVDTPVNPHSTLTEKMPTDSVHPQNSGYKQFAFTLFGALSDHS